MQTKILIRTLTFNSRYQQWYETGRNNHIEMLRGSYANEVFGLGSDDLAHEQSPAYCRITWQPRELEIEDLGFVMDYFQAVMLKNKYSNTLSDERYEVFDKGLKMTVHRHYMKPVTAQQHISSGTGHNLYGNIFFEHRFNGRYNALCLCANYHEGTDYESFEKLMEILLG